MQNERVFGVLRRMALWKNFFYHTLGAKSREVRKPENFGAVLKRFSARVLTVVSELHPGK
jgi:hypothetical protein